MGKGDKLFIRANELSELGFSIKAFEVFKKAAELADTGSQNNLGVCYEIGDGTAVNLKDAIFWYKKAIENGETESISNLAGLYAKHRSIDSAVDWYLKAIKSGDGDALLDLAQLILMNKDGLITSENVFLSLKGLLSQKTLQKHHEKQLPIC